jgi:hypothetical protein
VQRLALLLAVFFVVDGRGVTEPPGDWAARLCLVEERLAAIDTAQPAENAVWNGHEANELRTITAHLPDWSPGRVVVDRYGAALDALRSARQAWERGDMTGYREAVGAFESAVAEASSLREAVLSRGEVRYVCTIRSTPIGAG